jgi:hypothetical protein
MNKSSAEYLTESEFCKRYRVPPRSALRWRHNGTGPCFIRMGPRRIMYRVVDCEKWLAANTFQSTDDEPFQQPAPGRLSAAKRLVQ